MANNRKVIDIFDPQSGETKKWTRFSARLGDYLEKFPIKDGWRTVLERQLAASAASELLPLYQAALQAGINPREAGLPALPTGMIFTARLVSPDGLEVASGSATLVGGALFGQSGAPKEFECYETAAFQRLIAAVGFGGEVFDGDEDRSIAGVGSRVKETGGTSQGDGRKSSATLAVVQPGQADASASEPAQSSAASPDGLPKVLSADEALAGIAGLSRTPVRIDPVETSGAQEGKAETPAQPPAAAQPVVAITAKSSRRKGMAADSQLLAGMRRLLETLARQAGVQANPVTTLEEAETEQARLVALLTN